MDETPDPGERGPVEIPLDQLTPEALRGLVEEFVTRDGTDYGTVELGTEEKVARLLAQLEAGEACIVFDPEEERTHVVTAREWRATRRDGSGLER